MRQIVKMNCPMRTDPNPDEGYNQNPSDMAPEINTKHTLNHRRNSTNEKTNASIHLGDGSHDAIESSPTILEPGDDKQDSNAPGAGADAKRSRWLRLYLTSKRKIVKYGKFIGPGFMVSVSYIDPGMLVMHALQT